MHDFQDFFHDVNSGVIWGIILLVSIRAVYTSIRKKDLPHGAAFGFVLLFAAYMLCVALGVLDSSFLDMLFNQQ